MVILTSKDGNKYSLSDRDFVKHLIGAMLLDSSKLDPIESMVVREGFLSIWNMVNPTGRPPKEYNFDHFFFGSGFDFIRMLNRYRTTYTNIEYIPDAKDPNPPQNESKSE